MDGDDLEERVRALEQYQSGMKSDLQRHKSEMKDEMESTQKATISHVEGVVGKLTKPVEQLQKTVGELQGTMENVQRQNSQQSESMARIHATVTTVGHQMEESAKERERRKVIEDYEAKRKADEDVARKIAEEAEAKRLATAEADRKKALEEAEDKRKDKEMSIREKTILIGLIVAVLGVISTIAVACITGRAPHEERGHGAAPQESGHHE